MPNKNKDLLVERKHRKELERQEQLRLEEKEANELMIRDYLEKKVRESIKKQFGRHVRPAKDEEETKARIIDLAM